MNESSWHKMTLAQQLGNVGSDYERALRWKEKGNEKLFLGAAARTLEQLDATLSDNRLTVVRRREIARAREQVCLELFYPSQNSRSASDFTKYFFQMATLARKDS